jgi:outer membrane protein assembly factor BamB
MDLPRFCRIAALLLGLEACCAQAADAWPEWRGPMGQGHSDATNLPVTWSESEHVAWRTEIPGRGWSTPVVAAGRIWLTTGIDELDSPEDADRRRKSSTNSQPLRISESVSLRAVELDLATGKLVRDIEVLNQREPQMIHIDNSYATPTPIFDGHRLYCHFGPSGMACLDTQSGEVLWTNRSLYVEHENGAGSSAVLWNDLLIVHCDGIDQQYITALDAKTGKEVWKTARTGKLNDNPQLRKAYATPLVAKLNGKTQLISPAADWLFGYDPTSGQELWKLPYGFTGFSNSARPVVQGDMIFTTTGFMKAELLAIDAATASATDPPKLAWRFGKQVPNVSSLILVDNLLYMASDNGIATCLDASTGEVQWTERIGKRFWASPLYADGRLYFFDRDGLTTVIGPGKEFKMLAQNQLDGEIMAGAAAVDGALLVRTDKALYCLKQP